MAAAREAPIILKIPKNSKGKLTYKMRDNDPNCDHWHMR